MIIYVTGLHVQRLSYYILMNLEAVSKPVLHIPLLRVQ